MGDDILLKILEKIRKIRVALNKVNTSVSTIASTVSDDGTEDVSSGSWTTLASIELAAGDYIVMGSAQFASNSSGIRILIMSPNAEQANNDETNSVLGSGRSDLQRSNFYHLTATTTLYLRVYQNSGSTLSSCKGLITAVRLK